MSTVHVPDVRRASERDSDAPAEEPVAADNWRVRARQLLLARANAVSARAKHVLLAAATAAIDAGIAMLQRLRRRAGGAEQQVERRDHERKRPGKPGTTERSRGEAAPAATVAPKPPRRLRGVLVYLGLMLTGGIGGMAIAYELLAHLLERQSRQIERQDVKLSKDLKAVADMEKMRDKLQAAQIETEMRLAAALAQNGKQLGELQANRAEAQARLASAATERASSPSRQGDTGSNRGGRAAAPSGQPAWTRAGNCTLGKGNIRSVLNGCIADMNRK